MIPVRPPKRFQSSTNIKCDRLRKGGLLKGQFLFAPDICIPEDEILPPIPQPPPIDKLVEQTSFSFHSRRNFSLFQQHKTKSPSEKSSSR